MTWTRQFVIATVLLAGSFGAAGGADAADATSMEKAELAQLTPALKSQVEARLVSGQTVSAVLETMLLNNVSQELAGGHVVATHFQRGDFVVVSKGGQMKVFRVRCRHTGDQELEPNPIKVDRLGL